jgi:hypothetical protein
MAIFGIQSREVRWLAPFLVGLLFISGCGGITPYEPRNHREEGPKKGIFTGSEGEFVIFRQVDKPGADSEPTEDPDETQNQTEDARQP